MNKSKLKVINKCLIASILILVIDLCCYGLWKFNIKSTLYLAVIQGVFLIWFGESLIDSNNNTKIAYPHFILSILTVTIIILSIYLFGQGLAITGEKYTNWVIQLKTTGSSSIEYEIGTLNLLHLFIVLCVYHHEIWKMVRKDIYKCLPSLWCIMFGIGVMIYLKEDFNTIQRIGSLSIIALVMIIYLIYKTFIEKKQDTIYDISIKQYVIVFIGCFIGVYFIWNYIPDFQELPGARWLHGVVNSINKKNTPYEKIPYTKRLDSDIPLSEAILFEVSAMEPLYLREVAYSKYLDGIWYMTEANKLEELSIDFSTECLDAEYIQLDALLDEILFLNRQEISIFPEYANIASYETSIVRKKSYQVLQNPINKINYFTVNSLVDIKNQVKDKIYYYQDINNEYFFGESIIEPSNYTITYYDRIPKIGSREYVFLKSINGGKWQTIYNEVLMYRKRYGVYNEKVQKGLSVYTPLIQYQNAKMYFLQIPEAIKSQVAQFTRQLVNIQSSDWDNATAICNFLKNNYVYDLGSKKSEGDRVLNFLFEEKRGICQDFATSMTLMCRSVGIPAKYVTGYYTTEKNKQTGNYIIREKDAHAFVEVYIAGYGWMNFDPTPSRESKENKIDGTLDSSLQNTIKIIGIGSIILIGTLFLWNKNNYFKEKWWLVMFKVTPSHKKLTRLIRHQEEYLSKRGLGRAVGETLSQYAQRLRHSNIDITKSIGFYEAQKYGAIQVTKEEIQQAYQAYKTLKTILKKLK